MLAQPSAAGSGTPAPAPNQTLVVPDWGNQVSLFQTRQPAFWLYIVCLVIGGLLLLSDQVKYLNYSPVTFVVGLFLLALFAVPIFLVIMFLDLFEREPLSLMIGAFLWGALVVLPFVLPINNSWIQIAVKIFGPGASIPWLVAIVPPISEEGLKWIGIFLIFLIARSEFDDVLDGFIYGALVGLGFQVAEDMFYFFTRFIGPAGGVNEMGALIEGYWIRIISAGLYSHPLYAGISGIGIAYWATRQDQPKQKRIQYLVGAFVIAVLMHAFWNAPILDVLLGDNPGPINYLLYATVKGVPLIIFVFLVVRLATRREQTYFQLVMANEGTDVATPDELRELSDLRSRFFARRAMRTRKGPGAAKLLGRLHREQLKYALLATSTLDSRDSALAAQRELVRTLRSEIAGIPDVPKAVIATVPAQATVVVAAPSAPMAPAGWAPTHRVPATGQQSWDQPDPSRPVTMLSAGLELQVVQQVGDWARVLASNGWAGWVDARLLQAIPR